MTQIFNYFFFLLLEITDDIYKSQNMSTFFQTWEYKMIQTLYSKIDYSNNKFLIMKIKFALRSGFKFPGQKKSRDGFPMKPSYLDNF